MSEARKARSSVRPIRSGETRRAATIRSGSSAWMTATANAPRMRCRAVRRAAASPSPRCGRQRRLDQVGQDLAVRLGGQPVALGDQLVGQLDMVLEDAVVDEGQPCPSSRGGGGRWPPWAGRGWPTGCARSRTRRRVAPRRPAWPGRRASGCRWPPGPATGRPPAPAWATTSPAESYPRYSSRRRPSRSTGTTSVAGSAPSARPPGRVVIPMIPHIGRQATGRDGPDGVRPPSVRVLAFTRGEEA